MQCKIQRYVPEIIVIGALSQLKATQHYTTWNLLLSVLHRQLQIEPAVLFLNSFTVWMGFQFGATGGAKYRLMGRMKMKNVALMELFDLVAHTLPVLGWGYILLRDKRSVTLKQVSHQMAWKLAYFAIVVKGINARKQYGCFPYWRQVFQSVTAPFVGGYTINALVKGDCVPLVCSAMYAWHGLGYVRLVDEDSKNETPYYMEKVVK